MGSQRWWMACLVCCNRLPLAAHSTRGLQRLDLCASAPASSTAGTALSETSLCPFAPEGLGRLRNRMPVQQREIAFRMCVAAIRHAHAHAHALIEQENL
jgi:hypothetical protein